MTTYKFLRWEDEYGNILVTERTSKINVTEDMNLIAVYEEIEDSILTIDDLNLFLAFPTLLSEND